MTEKNDTQNNLKLQQTVRFFETLLRASADGILIIDPAKNIIFVNDTFCKFFSMKRQDVIETNLFVWLAKLDRNARDVWKGLESQINEHGIAKDVEFVSKTGEGMRYYSVNSSLLEKIDIEEQGLIISIWRDDTERKMAQEALQRAHDELEMRVEERTAQLQESERKYRRLFEYSNDIIIQVDKFGKVVAINNKLEETLGFTPEEVIGKYFFQLGILEIKELPGIIKQFKKAVLEGKINENAGKLLNKLELELRSKSGNFIFVETSTTILRKDGKIEGFLTNIRDITERKRAQKALQAERDNLVRIFEAMIDGVYIVDEKHDIQYVNPVLEKDFGPYKGRKCFEYFHDRTQSCPWCKNEDVFAGKTVRWEWYSSKNGRTYDLIDTPLLNPDGTIYKLEMFRDITERKQAEEALRESEEKYRGLVEGSPDAIVIYVDGKIVFANAVSVQLMRVSSVDVLLGQSVIELVHPDYREFVAQRMNAARTGGEILPFAAEKFIRFDGSAVDVEVKAIPTTFENKPAVQVIVRDITERKLAEEALRESEEKFKYVFDHSVAGKSLTLPSGQINVNQALCEMLGYSVQELKNHKWQEITHPDDVELTQNMMNVLISGEKQSVRFTKRYIHKNGSIVWTDLGSALRRDKDGKPLYFITTIIDITQRKHSEEIIQARNRLVEFSLSHSLDELLQKTLDEIEGLTGSQIGFFHFLEPDQRTIILQTWSTKTLQEMCMTQAKGTHYNISEAGVWVDCFYQRRPVIHNDYSALAHRKGLPSGHAPVIRELVIPIFQGDRITAIIGVGNKPVDYNEKDVETVKLLVDLGWDLVERKRAEESLRESEEKYRILVERSNDGIVIIQDGIVKFANTRLAQLWGGSVEGLLETPMIRHIHPNERDKVMERYKLRLDNENIPPIYETVLLRKDGSAIHIEINAGIIKYAGKLADLIMIRDITERKRAQEQNMMLKHSIDVFYDGIYWMDSNNKFIYINDAGCKVLGYSREELMSKTPLDINPKATEQGLKIVWELLRSKGFFFSESVHRRKDGTEFPVEIMSTYVQFAGREYNCGFARDITKRKQAEEELLKSKFLLNQTQKISKIGGGEYDVVTGKMTWTEEIYRIYGVTPADYDPNSIKQGFEFYVNGDKDIIEHAFKKAVEEGETYDLELKFRNAQGKDMWVRTTGRPEYKDGRVVRVHGYIMDITDRKLAEEERIQLLALEHEARTEAEAARKLDRMKSMFLASTSHELRTPLNSVIGFSSMLLEGYSGMLNTDQKEQLEIVHSSGKHLLTLINDIIDISKIEAGNINLEVSEFKLKPIVDEAVSMLRVSLSEKKLDLKVNVQDIVMRSDRTRLFQCIVNLLSNAIKYTEKGSVEINVKVINNTVIITVSDTGIGIDTEDIPKIFGPFVRLQTPLTYKTSGTGLGLYMVKKIAKEFLGGDIEVESVFGKGSTFTLHVPVELQPL